MHVLRVQGLRSRRRPKQDDEWYCVRARVAVQVEGEAKGLQTIEDRFVLVMAGSFRDAERRLQRHWREYATPYLNPEGQLVRWQCEEILDVYATGDTDVDTRGFEVYSKLGSRRMKPRHVWHARRGDRS